MDARKKIFKLSLALAFSLLSLNLYPAHAAILVEVEEFKPENSLPAHHFLAVTDPQARQYLLEYAKGVAPKKLLSLKNGVLNFTPLEKGNCSETPFELCMGRIVKVYRCPESNDPVNPLESCTPVRGLYVGRSPAG